MFDTLLTPLLTEMYGKSFHTIAAELTGINERTWRDGGPKSKSKQNQIPQRIKNKLQTRFEKERGYTKEEAINETERIIGNGDSKYGFFSSLVVSFGKQCGLDWPSTENLALELDLQSAELTERIRSKNFPALKKKLLDLFEDPTLAEWCLSLPDTGNLLEEAHQATVMNELIPLSTCWATAALYSMLACWDVEFQSRFLNPEGAAHQLELRPLFQFLMPALNTKGKEIKVGTQPSRGLFILPMRRLLELSYCLANFGRYRNFPKGPTLRRCDVEGWAGEKAKTKGTGNIAKIYRGSMGLSAFEFQEIWHSMCGMGSRGEHPLAPWPIYVATQLWTLLYVKKSQINGSKTATELVAPAKDAYEFWWHHQYSRLKIPAQTGKVISWPLYLFEPR